MAPCCSPDKVQAPAGVGIPQRGARKALEKVGLKYGCLQGGSKEVRWLLWTVCQLGRVEGTASRAPGHCSPAAQV